jgi:nucleotide-binding universal stress UspA family protein
MDASGMTGSGGSGSEGSEIGAAATIVVGYSPKPEGRAALDRAIRIALLGGSKIIVVNTVPEEQTTAVDEQLADSGLSYQIHQLPDLVEPADELIKVSESSPDAMIVIGLRRRSPVGKLLLGSNAQRVLLDASCPVLAVKAEGTSAR